MTVHNVNDLEAFVRKHSKQALEKRGAFLESQNQIDHLVGFLLAEVGLAIKKYDPTKKATFSDYAGWLIYKRTWSWYRSHAWEVGIYPSDEQGRPELREVPMSGMSAEFDDESSMTGYADSQADQKDHYAVLLESLSESEIESVCAKLSEESAWTLCELMIPYADGENTKTDLAKKHSLSRVEMNRRWRQCVAEVKRLHEGV